MKKESECVVWSFLHELRKLCLKYSYFPFSVVIFLSFDEVGIKKPIKKLILFFPSL